jgi:hypothetical protein
MAKSFNTELIKYGLLIASAPFWLPFIKALWQELNDSLRDEGGLLGVTPSAEKLRDIDREKGAFESPLVSEPRAEALVATRQPTRARRVRAAPEPYQRARPRGFR